MTLPLSWNEIQNRSVAFANEWTGKLIAARLNKFLDFENMRNVLSDIETQEDLQSNCRE